MIFPRKIERLALDRRLNYKTIAFLAGLNAARLGKIIRGRECAQTPDIQKLAGFFSVDPDWLGDDTQTFPAIPAQIKEIA